MDKKMIAYLLKLVTVLVFIVFLFAGLYLVPVYMRFMQHYVPSIGPVFIGVLVYINLSFVPVYLCLVMAWQVFTTIAKDTAFCLENGTRLLRAAWLALADVVMVVGFYLFMRLGFANLINPFFLFLTLGFIVLGLSAAIVCFALSKLVTQAAELKQEADLTI